MAVGGRSGIVVAVTVFFLRKGGAGGLWWGWHWPSGDMDETVAVVAAVMGRGGRDVGDGDGGGGRSVGRGGTSVGSGPPQVCRVQSQRLWFSYEIARGWSYTRSAHGLPFYLMEGCFHRGGAVLHRTHPVRRHGVSRGYLSPRPTTVVVVVVPRFCVRRRGRDSSPRRPSLVRSNLVTATLPFHRRVGRWSLLGDGGARGAPRHGGRGSRADGCTGRRRDG